jgi:hypothetical protein
VKKSPSNTLTRRQSLPELQSLQRQAARMIMRPLGRDMQTNPKWTDGRDTAPIAATFIKPNDRLTSLERIEIYNRQYWFRLIDCLYDDYPGLLAVIGQSKFNNLIRQYLHACPSRSFTLRNLGSRLESFISRNPDLVKPRQQLAQEMAAFEWAQIVAFDGPALPPLTVEDLRAANPSKLRLTLQPFITLLNPHWPLDDYTTALKRQQAALRSEASNAIDTGDDHSPAPTRNPRLKRQRVFIAVHRHDYDLYYRRLAPEPYKLLCALNQGKSLAAACNAAIIGRSQSIDWAARINYWFRTWTSLGWLCKRGKSPRSHASK